MVRTRHVLPVLLAAWASACGARTGLPVTDAVRDATVAVDAGVDLGVDAGEPCIEVPLDGGPVMASMQLEAQVGRADVVFLVDVTSSMLEEIERIRARLRDRIAPAIREAIPDSQMAVASFGDFPVDPYGVAGVDVPFTLVSPSTPDVARVQAAMDTLRTGNGGDSPESQVEALYQLATGEGLRPYIEPSGGCPSGGFGYACIRRDALPVVLLFTDAPMHNGPAGGIGDPYSSSLLRVVPHSFSATVTALQSRGARVIGFDSGGGAGASDLVSLALRTGTLDGRGSPLVYDIGSSGERLSEEVVTAVRTFASTLVQDVDAVVRDPDPTDGVDANLLVAYVDPVSASPATGVASIDEVAHVFRQVTVGTQLTFQLVVRSGVLVPGNEPRFVRVEVVFRGNGRTRLGSRIVTLLVPARDGRGCDDL